MDIVPKLKSIIEKLEKDNAWLDASSKNQYAKEELASFICAHDIAGEEAISLETGHCAEAKNFQSLARKYVSNKIPIVSSTEKSIHSSDENTATHQREKLEIAIKSLCFLLEVEKVEYFMCSRGNIYYKAGDHGSYQSATNTLLALSTDLVMKKLGARSQ